MKAAIPHDTGIHAAGIKEDKARKINSSAKGNLLNNLSFTTFLNYIFEGGIRDIDNKKKDLEIGYELMIG